MSSQPDKEVLTEFQDCSDYEQYEGTGMAICVRCGQPWYAHESEQEKKE